MSYLSKIEKLEDEVAEKQKQLKALRDKQSQLVNSNPIAVAEYLHEHECHLNHTDGCGWDYEKWGSPLATTRNRWLKLADRFISFTMKNNIDIKTALELRTMSNW